MLDRFIYPQAQPFLSSIAAKLNAGGMGAGKISIAAFVAGLTGCFCVGMQLYIPGLVFLLLGRFGAGLAATDSASLSPRRAFLTTLADFIVFGTFVFFFTLGMPQTSMAAAFAIFSILVMGLSYMGSQSTGKGGIVGQSEMILFMIVCCVFPPAFPAACIFFGLLCWVTAVLRAVTVSRALKNL